jgi:hypothetical protein
VEDREHWAEDLGPGGETGSSAVSLANSSILGG